MEQRRRAPAPLGVGGVPVAKHRHEWGARACVESAAGSGFASGQSSCSESTSVAVLIALVHELRVPNLGSH